MNTIRRGFLCALLTFVLWVPAIAHPLGNFTINRLSELEVRSDRIAVRYVLDIAEIPAFSIIRTITPAGKLNDLQLALWAQRETRDAIVPFLHVTADGKPIALSIENASARVRPGAGGLSTLYLVLDASAPIETTRPARIEFVDDTFSGRIGWRDVIVKPATEPTRELTSYPATMLTSPPNVTSVSIVSDTGGANHVTKRDFAGTANPVAASAIPAGRSNQLSDMLAKGTRDPVVVILTLLVALALGALHALEPGHGKTLLAVTLVGARATVPQAAILAGALTLAHTAAVLALGIAINVFKGYLVPEDVYPWITLLSGAAIAIMGARSVARQLKLNVNRHQAHEHAHVHEHTHDGAHPHNHPHAHGHTHAEGSVHGHDHGNLSDAEHARLHAIPGTAAMQFGPTVWAAMSGGIAPCPAALVVLLAAIALNEVLYGIVVIVAFSFGLAAMLTGIGIAVVRGTARLGKHPAFARVVRYGPIASATIMAGIGCIMLGQGFRERGIDISPIVVSVLAALAISGYAFTQAAGHPHAKTA